MLLSRRATFIIAVIGGLLLSLLIVFPPHYDQYVFYVGGEKLVGEGAVPFRDLMDTKPGLIFYIYGISTWLFGHSLYAARWLDFLFHLGALYYFYVIIRREFNRHDIALLSIIIYVVFYIAGGPFATGQAESFALIANLILLDTTCRLLSRRTTKRNSWRYGMIAGIAGIILFMLKYTLALFLVVPMLLAIANKRNAISYIGSFAVTMFFGLGAWFGYLGITGALPNVIENLRWLAAYSATNPIGDLATINDKLFVMFTEHATTSFSLSFIGLGAAGAFALIKKKQGEFTGSRIIAGFLLLQFVVAVISILLERKFLYYQFTRAFWCAAPFIAYGIIEAWTSISAVIRKRRIPYFIGAIAGLGVLFYSPLMEIAGFAKRTATASSFAIIESIREAMIDQVLEKEYRFVAQELQPHLQNDDKIFAFGHHTGLYFHLNRTSPSFILNSGFITASWTNPRWKMQMLGELARAKPKFILIEFNDVVPIINASLEDSWDHFEKWSEFRNWVYEHYDERMPINRYRIFKRRL